MAQPLMIAWTVWNAVVYADAAKNHRMLVEVRQTSGQRWRRGEGRPNSPTVRKGCDLWPQAIRVEGRLQRLHRSERGLLPGGATTADIFIEDVLHGGTQDDAALIAELFEATIVYVPPQRAPLGGRAWLRPQLGGVVGIRVSLGGTTTLRPQLGGRVGFHGRLGGRCYVQPALGGLAGVGH